jgi:hypothetical protein
MPGARLGGPRAGRQAQAAFRRRGANGVTRPLTTHLRGQTVMNATNTSRAIVRFKDCPPCVPTPKDDVRILDGGIDTIHFSFDAPVSRETYLRR